MDLYSDVFNNAAKILLRSMKEEKASAHERVMTKALDKIIHAAELSLWAGQGSRAARRVR